MINLGWTEYDPLEGSAQSIDPLRSLAHAVRLGDLVFPGSSGRIWRIRYIPALCFLLKKATLERGQEYRSNYIKFRKFENAFILAICLLRQRFESKYDFGRVPGLGKGEDLIKSNPNRIDIQGDILANQMNLGPLGQYSVMLQSFELIDSAERELILYPNGENLADLYEKSIAEDAKTFLNSIDSTKLKYLTLEDLSAISGKMHFEYLGPEMAAEQKQVTNLLLSNPTRRQLFKDLTKLKSKTDLSEYEIIKLLNNADSPLQSRYHLIKCYDSFQSLLHYYFMVLRQIPTNEFVFSLKNCSRLESAFSDLKDEIKNRASSLISAVDDLTNEESDLDLSSLSEIKEYAVNINLFLSHYAEFTEFLIAFHQKHQKAKGKAPWVRQESPSKVEVSPINIYSDPLPSLTNYSTQSVHSYRFSNALQMIKDLHLSEDVT